MPGSAPKKKPVLPALSNPKIVLKAFARGGIIIIMNYKKYITVNPKILVGKPIITGTRIPVELILKMLAEGMNINEIITGYPRLTKKDIQAAIWYAKELVEEERIYPLTS